MQLSAPPIGLPLLAKELTEQSARRRTYIIRVVYAVALYGFTLWAFWNQLGSWNSNSFTILGRGRELFEALAWLQFCGLYLFLPAMACGVLTTEKERDTLALLLLTKLGPWTIVFEKLFSRLVPMASFVLLSTPLLAVAYSLGGVEAEEILILGWSLTVTALQVGALAILCSAWCRTTAAAFVSTYLIGGAVFLGPALLTQGGHSDLFGLVSAATNLCQSLGLLNEQRGEQEVVFMLFGPWLALHPNSRGVAFAITVLRSLPMLACAGTCLLLARVVLWRRAFVPPSNYLLKLFKSLDAFFHKANQNRFTKGIVLIHESVTLPLYDPIRWRETHKRSLGTTRYLIRLLLVLEVPVLFGMLIPYNGNGYNDQQFAPAYVIAWILWFIAALVLTVQSTGLIGLERSKQTLDVLLTTQMSSEAIVREKFSGVWRMIRMLWIPFATVYLFQIWWATWVRFDYGYYSTSDSNSVAFGVVRGLLATAIYPPLIAWIGFHQGMRQRSQTQATLVTLGLLAGVCLIPWLVAVYSGGNSGVVFNNRGQAIDWPLAAWIAFGLMWLSPAYVLYSSPLQNHNQYVYYGDNFSQFQWIGMLLHFAGCGVLLVWLWARGMKTFARHVHRNDGQIVDDSDIDRLASLRQQIVGSGVFRKTADE